MPSGSSLRRKLSRKVIDRLGLDTTLLRAETTVTKDRYGEPVETPWVYTEFDIRIVIDQEKMVGEQTQIGGLNDDKKDILCFYCKGDFDIRIGDKIIYPPASDNEWLIKYIDPQVFKGVVVISECRAYRDDRT